MKTSPTKTKILSDFDGVITNQIDEALQVRSHFIDSIGRTADLTKNDAEALFLAGEKEMLEAPELHGWRSGDRISAFANEDFFIRNNALASFFDQISLRKTQSKNSSLQAKVLDLFSKLQKTGYKSFNEVADQAFRSMAKTTAESGHKPLDPPAVQTLKKVLEKKHSITIVSNSGTDRIQNMLKPASLDQEIKIRGDAKKFELSSTPKEKKVGRYNMATDRPNYEKIILELQPDIFIGDVLSLDLALPLRLLEEGALPHSRGILLLRTRDYTPQWSLDFCRSYQGKNAKFGILDRFEDLLNWVD